MNTLMTLIKEKRYDKRIDDFKQTECSICFDEFKKGIQVRKIPICRHIFHTKCIEKWFKSKEGELVHKCPLCNCEITVEKIKEIMKKRKEEAAQRRLGKVTAIMPMLE